MPPRKSKAAKQRDSTLKKDSKTVEMFEVKVKATLDVTVVESIKEKVNFITNDCPHVTSVVVDATSVFIDHATHDFDCEELDSEDDEKNSSVLMTPEKTPHKKSPLAPHIITTPPIQSPKLRSDIKREQKTLETIQEKVNFIANDCLNEALDSPAAKLPRGKPAKRGGTTGGSRTRGCHHKGVIASRVTVITNDNVPSRCRSTVDGNSSTKESESSSENKTSEELVDCGANRKLHDTKISDYYPIRRSSRRTEAELKKEIDKNFQHCIELKEQDGLEIKEFVGKGRGIVATRVFNRNEFVVEYAGDLIDVATAKAYESEYLAKKSGCYMYYFNHKNKNYCIDATPESVYFGRLVNHSRLRPNCHTKVVEVKGRPHLVLLASRKIETGEELLYDYGDRSKEALAAHPWLAL